MTAVRLSSTVMAKVKYRYDRDEECLFITVGKDVIIAKIPGERKELMTKVATNMKAEELAVWINEHSTLRMKVFTEVAA